MEMMGKNPGSKGELSAYLMMPSGTCQQSRIGKFDMKDKKNMMYVKDVIKFVHSALLVAT